MWPAFSSTCFFKGNICDWNKWIFIRCVWLWDHSSQKCIAFLPRTSTVPRTDREPWERFSWPPARPDWVQTGMATSRGQKSPTQLKQFSLRGKTYRTGGHKDKTYRYRINDAKNASSNKICKLYVILKLKVGFKFGNVYWDHSNNEYILSSSSKFGVWPLCGRMQWKPCINWKSSA